MVNNKIENTYIDMEDTLLALERLETPGKTWTQKEVEEGLDKNDERDMYECSFCGVTTKYDHDGNGCHSCLKGAMRKVDIDEE